jgi:hypothetical protein
MVAAADAQHSEAKSECIKVVVRVRPPVGAAESNSSDSSHLQVDGNSILLRAGKHHWGNKAAANSAESHCFKFDHIAAPDCAQQDLFQKVCIIGES